ncbi:MAG: hypothetical protein LUD69_07990, partial [Oscillospiraceae bacterium]|nr:hypothetical protein [Oscillospiraceae bacterium]
MAIKIKFDAAGNPEPPILVLATRSGDKFGQIPAGSINIADYQNEPSEIQFQVHKYDSDGELVPLWDELVNFRLVWCQEWDVWFEATVSLDEDTETVKTVNCTRLGQAELSQIMLYDIEINTEDDIARDDYERATVFYSTAYPEASLLDRIMEKAPHYSIAHVDDTLVNIQRTFSFDGTSLYDAFQEIATEIGCLFVFDSESDDDGKPNRTISVYDLESTCASCGYRGEFTTTCPECGGTTINEGYGEDTTIFVTADALGSNIQFTTDTDSVKNCFRLVGGDDLMTATIRNCNPNGTSYIWYLTDDMKTDMSDELVTKLDKYDELYAYYKDEYVANISSSVITEYNELVKKYQTYNSDLETLDTSIVGYAALMNAYYNAIDLELYLQSTLMPDVTTSESDASEQAALLTASNLSPVAVASIDSVSTATATSAVLAMAKAIVSSKYQVKVNDGATLSGTAWTGSFTVTNYSDDEDTATSSTISVTVTDDYEEYLLQLIEKELSADDTDDVSITGLFAYDIDDFEEKLKLYCLDSLTSFHDSCQACLDILIEQGVGNADTWAGEDPNLYDDLYAPYYEKLMAIENEMALREEEIELITGVYDSDGNLETGGVQTYIEAERDAIQEALDFETYVGEDLWLEFCAYRREDEYNNSNYISDGLDNAELFERALEFIEVAENEIYKSAELQHSISATLKNLLIINGFEALVDYFEIGNWLRIRVDDDVYKLRLIGYGIDYDNLDEITVEFSDVVKTATGVSDMESILSQASSMATSYSATQQQASQGSSASSVVSGWRTNGLDVTNTKIISGADNQSQTWDSHGMLFRKYDPLTDSYEAEQSKIVNSTYAITDDNWKTIRTAIGRFYYVDPTTGELTSAYGVNGEVLVGNLILGESLGIYTADGSMTFDANGLTIDTSSGVAFTITNNGNTQFYIDANGNVVLDNGASLVWGNIDLTDLILNADNVVSTDDDGNTVTFQSYLQTKYLNAQYITSECIDTQYLNADVVDAYLANIVNLNAENLSTNYLSAAIADIAKANITDLVAENITADYIATLLLEADTASVNDLYAKVIEAETANIQTITSESITSDYIATRLLEAESATVDELFAKVIDVESATIEELAAGTITADTVSTALLTADTAVVDELYAEIISAQSATIEELAAGTITADNISTALLEADTAVVEELYASIIEAESATITDLVAGTITSDVVATALLEADVAEVKELYAKIIEAETATIENIVSTNIDAEYISSTLIEAQTLEAEQAYVEELYASIISATEAQINTIISGQVTSDYVLTTLLDAESATINDLYAAVIEAESATIQELAATTITAENISTALLAADEATVGELYATIIEAESATIQTLTTEVIDTAYIAAEILEADSATIGELQATLITSEYITSNIVTADYINTAVLDAESATINYLTSEYISTVLLDSESAMIGYLETNYIEAGTIDADYITTTLLVASEANVADLQALIVTSAYVSSALLAADAASIAELQAVFVTAGTVTTAILNASEANIADLQAALITVGYIDALFVDVDEADITNLRAALVSASYIATTLLEADSANIAELQVLFVTADVITSVMLSADEAYIADLQAALVTADYIDTLLLNSGTATFGELYSTVANIESVLAGNIGAGSLTTVHLTSDNVVVDDAVITSAMIASVTADKITSGTIYTTRVKIQTAEDDASLVIADGTIQISDGTYVRVQIGEDASGDYNLYLWNSEGTLIWNAEGLTEEGLGGNGAIIKDLNVADDAAISGSKLDIQSVASALNKDGSLVVDAASVTIDNTTLSAAYTSIIQQLDDYESSLSDLESNSVANIVTYYAIGTSSTESPGDPDLQRAAAYTDTAMTDESQTDLVDVISGVWTTEQLTAGEDEYLWICYKQEMLDGSVNWTTPFCITDSYVRSQTTTLVTELTVIQGQISSFVSVDTLTETVDSIGDTITEVQSQYSSLVETVDGITETVIDLTTTVGDNYTELSDKYTTIETTVSGITETVADLSTTVGDNYTELSDKYTTIETTVNGITTTISDLEATIDTVSGNYTTLSEQYTTIEATVEGITTTVASLTSTVDSLSSTVTSVSVTLDGISASVSSIESTVSNLTSTAATEVVAYYAIGSSDTKSPGDPDTQRAAAYTDTAITDDSQTDLVDVLSGVWYTDAPSTTEDCPYLWVAYRTVTVDGTVSWSEPTCITDSNILSQTTTLVTELTVIQGEISTLVSEETFTEAINSLGETITTVSDNYSFLTETVSSIESEVGTLTTTVSDNYTELTNYYSSIRQDVDTITSTVAEIETTVYGEDGESGLSGTVTTLTENYSEIEQTVSSVSSTIIELETTIYGEDGESGLVSTVSSNYSEVIQLIDSVTTTIASLTTTVDDLEDDYTTISNTIASQSITLDSITTSVSTIESTVSGITSTAATEVTAYYAIGSSATVSPGDPDTQRTAAYTDTAVTDDSQTDLVNVISGVWYTDAPDTTEDCPYLWVAYKTVTIDGEISWSEPTCISDAYLISSVSDMGSSITQTEEFIENKVWESYTETYVGKILYGEDGDSGVYAELTGEITTLSSKYSTLTQTVGDISSTVTSLSSTVSSNYTTLYEYYSTVDQRVDSVVSSVSALSTTVSDNYSALSSQYSEISQTVDSISSSVSSLTTTVSDNYSTLSSQISSLTISLDSITTSVTSIQSEIEGFEAGLTDVTPYFASFADDTDPSDPALCVAAAYTDTAKTDESLVGITAVNSDWSENCPDAADGYTIWVSFRQVSADGTVSWTTPVTYASAGYVSSKIEQLADSITLSVTGGLGSTASIVLSVDGTETAIDSVDLSAVRTAFANDTTAITVSAGTITFSSNTLVIDSTYFDVTAAGVITATSGTIGAITLSSTGIHSYNSSVSGSYTGWYRPSTIASSTIAFFAGATSATGTSATFKVTYGGALTATGVDISGTITATDGTIGALTLSSTGIYSYNSGVSGSYAGWYKPSTILSTSTAFFAGATDATGTGATFSVTYGGALTATGATISGSITATDGTIGGWTIGDTAIYNGTTSMASIIVGTYIGQSGFRQYASSSAYINMQNGVLTATGVNISGKITATSGTIGDITISSTGIYSSNASVPGTYAGWYKPSTVETSSIAFFAGASSATGTSATFKVTYGGNLTATSGTIGNISLSSTGIYSRYISGTTASSTDTAVTDSAVTDGTGVYTGWYKPTSVKSSSISFFAGASDETGTDAPFYVTYSGAITATSGT